MRRIALIPAKAFSSRVPEKNFRPFFEQSSLLDVKLMQAIESGLFDEIYISSDSPEASQIAARHGVSLIERDEYLTLSDTPWSEVVSGILKSLPGKELQSEISWLPVTSPLFLDFGRVIREFNGSPDSDSAITVTPLTHFLLTPEGMPANFQFGKWHRYSQDLKPYFVLNWAMVHSTVSNMLELGYPVGVNPLRVEVSPIEGWDIDTLEEFEIAQTIYRSRQNS
jgi:CMP-N-acetylneuraminic acid synthetase